jgi:hypothetical protein
MMEKNIIQFEFIAETEKFTMKNLRIFFRWRYFDVAKKGKPLC